MIPPDSVRCIVSILQQKLYRNVQSGNHVGVFIEENIQTKRVVAQLEQSTANRARCKLMRFMTPGSQSIRSQIPPPHPPLHRDFEPEALRRAIFFLSHAGSHPTFTKDSWLPRMSRRKSFGVPPVTGGDDAYVS